MPNYPEATEGPNGEPIVACDVTKPANNAVLRIMGTRIGFRDDGQREYLVKLRGLEALEWLTNKNLKGIEDKLKKFKQTMGWSDCPDEKGREFMVPPDAGNKKIAKPPAKPAKPAYPTAKKGPNGEPIAVQCDERPDIASIRRIMGTRVGFVDNGKHEFCVKVDGKDELVWLQEAHAGEFRQLVDAYKKETGEPHLRRKIGIEYFVGRDVPRQSGRWSRNRYESHLHPLELTANYAPEWSAADGINENYTAPTTETLQTSVGTEQPSRRPIEPLVDSSSTVASHDSSVNKNRDATSNAATASKQPQSKHDALSSQQPDAEIARSRESRTQSTKKRVQAEVHTTDGTMDRLAQDIVYVGTKKSKMVESEQDRLVRLFYAAREAHKLHADLRLRCEKLVEFVVDESYIGNGPQDRQELFERLLEMCKDGVLPEHIDCDDPRKKRVLMSYNKRLQAWKVICDLFPGLVEEFEAQPRVQLPTDVLTGDAFKKINEYLDELKAVMHSMPKALKEAVVWQLLESVGHPYDRCTEEVRKLVAERIRKKVP